MRLRQSRWYALGQSFLSHITSSPPSPQQKQKYSCVCLPSGRSFRFFGFSLAFLAFSSFSITTALWIKHHKKNDIRNKLPKVWSVLETGLRRSMSSPLAAPRGIRSSCLTHSYKMFSCCPHSGGCSWMSALCLQEHSTLNKSFSLVAVHEMYKDTRRSSSRHSSSSSSINVHSPASMSQSAKSPMRTSPFTVHFCVSQFGLQLWFINRAEFPLGPASITRSCEGRTKAKIHENLGIAHWGSLARVSLWCHSCYLGKGKHVEVGHVIFMSTFDSLLALLWVYHLSHILGHKVTLETNNKFTVYIF